MSVKSNFNKLLLVSTACAVLAACGGGGSVSSPGATNPGTPPSGGGGGGGGTGVNIDLTTNGCGAFAVGTFTLADGGTLTACEMSGNITADTTLVAGSGYVVSGPVFIGEDVGNAGTSGIQTIVTVPAGTQIIGANGADYLVVTRGSQLRVLGTQAEPVIMTSISDIDGSVSAADRGEWGGLIINGRAPINDCDSAVAGGTADCTKSGEGGTGLFGGDIPTDNSGIYQYMQLRYAGFEISTDNELNGIAFQGVGNGTTVNNIQVHNNKDDGIEMFGGTVDMKYVVLSGIGDDSMDYTDGWTGRAQFVLVVQEGTDADQGFEFDNRGGTGGANDQLPRSNPIISNFTLIGDSAGAESDQGILIREGSAGQFYNGIVTNFTDECLDIDQDATFARLAGEGASGTAGDEILDIRSVVLDCPNGNFSESGGDPVDLSTWFLGRAGNAEITNTLDGILPGPVEQSVASVDVNAIDPWFTSASYVGAFGPAETVNNNWTTGWTFGDFSGAGSTACPTGTVETGEVLNFKRVCRVSGSYTADLTLDKGSIYELSGPVFIGEDGGASAILTIEPGVTVFGANGADYLVVARGSEIRSNGTQAEPVIMTSRSDVEGTVGDTDRGEWGGLIINGFAPINDCDSAVAGGSANCTKSGEGGTGLFGGDQPADDSGNLYYTQVKFAGFEISTDNELNGIAFQGVGSGTEVSHIQVHNNKDDGIEMFGGTVDMKYVLLTGIGDDSMDYTDGWNGRAQFVLVVQEGTDADQGFEFDNRGGTGGANDQLPRSNPMISNFTLIGAEAGAESDQGMLIREGSAGQLYNGIVTNFTDECLDIDQDATFARLAGEGATGAAGDEILDIQSVALDCTTNFSESGGDPVDLSTWFLSRANNVEYTSSLTDVYMPGAAETGLTATDVNAIDAWFTSVNYVGAIDPSAATVNDTWVAGWSFQPPWFP
jgi:hypothetical protein